MADEIDKVQAPPEIGQQRSAPDWVIEALIEEADTWISEETINGATHPFAREDISYLATRMGAVAGLQAMPTSDAAQAKALEMFEIAARRDAVGAAIAWAVGTDQPMPMRALAEAGVSGLPRGVTDHQRSSRHAPTKEALFGNIAAVTYDSPLVLDTIDALRDGFVANAGKFGATMRVDPEVQERAREAAQELSETGAGWPAGVPLDPETLGALADTIGKTQGLVGFEVDPDTRQAGLDLVSAFAAADAKSTALAWAMGTDRPFPRALFADHGIDELPRSLAPQLFRDDHARIRQLLTGLELERDPDQAHLFEQDIALNLRAFEGRQKQDNAVQPNEAAATAAATSWMSRNPPLGEGITPQPLTHAEVGELADVIGMTVGLKKVPTSDASRDLGITAFERAVERDPQGALVAWSLGTNLAPPKTLMPDGQSVHMPREVTEYVRESDYRRSLALIAGGEPTTTHDNRFTRDAIEGMRAGFAKTAEAAPQPHVVEAAVADARAYAQANAGRWGAEHDPHFNHEELGQLRDILGTTVGLRKRPTSEEAYTAGISAFETALQRDPAGAMIAWAKATDLPMPHDSLERRGIDSVPREVQAYAGRSGVTARTSALLDGVPPPPETDPRSYVEVAITGELRRACERAGIDDITPERLRRQINDAKRQANDARRQAAQHLFKGHATSGQETGTFVLKDLFVGYRAGKRLAEMRHHNRTRREHEQSLKAAVTRGQMRIGPATTFERVAVPGLEQAAGPVGMMAAFSRMATRVSQSLNRQSAERTREADLATVGPSFDTNQP